MLEFPAQGNFFLRNSLTNNLMKKPKLLALPACLATAFTFAAIAGFTLPASAEDEGPAVTTTVVSETVAAVEEAPAEEEPSPIEKFWDGKTADLAVFTVNNLWICIAAALVFLMHLGFAGVESGLTQSKNTTNILFKNLFIVCMGLLAYAAYGFNAMYPGDNWTFGKFFALGSPIANGFTEPDAIIASLTSEYNAGYTYWTDFLFQAMFAATAATIVSG